jgi:hypothetical protein
VLRAQVNDYLFRVLPKDHGAKKEDIRKAVTEVIERFPQVLDFYIREKEDHGNEAVSVSRDRVHEVETWFVEHVREFVRVYLEPGWQTTNRISPIQQTFRAASPPSPRED